MNTVASAQRETLGEFELIERYFSRPTTRAALGPGDDCALLAPAAGTRLAVSSDMLVEGRHFLPGADPRALGHKALAVNLSDLAACGARPVAFTLALALPEARAQWLQPFSEGLYALADAHACELIGGDTTRGPLTICITVFGEVPQDMSQVLLRSAARAGDDLWVSGTLGDARLALEAHRQTVSLTPEQRRLVQPAMDRPQPRVGLGVALRGVAHAAIDISDGLLGDLGHVLRRSQLGARLNVDALPLGPTLRAQSKAMQLECGLNGGDDYELLFTAAPERREAVMRAGAQSGVALTRIGVLTPEPGLHLHDEAGHAVALRSASFDHFKTP